MTRTFGEPGQILAEPPDSLWRSAVFDLRDHACVVVSTERPQRISGQQHQQPTRPVARIDFGPADPAAPVNLKVAGVVAGSGGTYVTWTFDFEQPPDDATWVEITYAEQYGSFVDRLTVR